MNKNRTKYRGNIEPGARWLCGVKASDGDAEGGRINSQPTRQFRCDM